MPSDSITVESHNFDELRKAFEAAPKITERWVKTALFRFARRVARHTKRDYLHGGAGIKGGPWARLGDKNVRGFAVGQDLSNLKAISKVSRIVRTHVEGAVITPRQAGYLYLSTKTRVAGQGTVFARARAVTIPARIPFESVWREALPKGSQEVLAAADRALRLSMDERMKVMARYMNKVLSHG